MADWIEQLERLTQLHRTGALTDAEFAAQKARLLAAQDAVPTAAPTRYQSGPGWEPREPTERSAGVPKVLMFGVPALMLVLLAAWFGSTLVTRRPDPGQTSGAISSATATDAVLALATPTAEPAMPVALDGTLQYAAADQCKPGPVLEALYKKLDAAMALGSGKGVTVKLDAWDRPLAVWAKSVTDQTGLSEQDGAIKFPEATTWHGLRLSRLSARRLSPADNESTYIRSISFLEPADKVQKTLARLGFGAPREPEVRPLSDDTCGGMMRVVALNGGSALTCSWGCGTGEQ